MAMRQQPLSSRIRPLARPVYDDFQPSFERKENKDAVFLHIQLPGFTKERINITYSHAYRKLKVSGERPIEGNRWVRFRQEYSVPANCEAEKLHSKFEKGVLTVTMPKKFIKPVSPQEQVNNTIQEETVPSKQAAAAKPLKPEKDQDVIPPKSTPSSESDSIERGSASELPEPVKGPAELKPQKGQEENSAQRPIDSRKPEDTNGLRAEIPTGPEPLREPVPQKGPEEIVQKQTLATAKPQKGQEEIEENPTLKMLPGKQTDEKPQKGQEEIQPQTTKITTPIKQLDEKPQEEAKQKATLTAVPQKQTDEKNIVGTSPEDAEKERVLKKEVKETDEKPSKSRIPENDVETFTKREKEIRRRNEVVKAAEGSALEAQEKEKETTGEAAASDKGKHEEYMADTIGKAMKEVATSASQVASRIAEGKWNEDKPLLVNVGVAALVIAALGAYISYKFTSSGKL